ncbi:MAG: carboxy terminal-processing peptidase, partial [Lentisphaerae bacterium]|nr:carboxy terminal-processing peptidase [Lentisphaerota bacterium]
EDRIIAVAQDNEPAESILHWPLYKTVKKIRGEKGSRVVLTVISAADPTGSTTKIVDLIRDEVKLEEQAATWQIHRFTKAGNQKLALGVITLPTFYANLNVRSKEDPSYKSCADDVRTALSEMKEQKADGVLLDLRNNGGGALFEAVKLTGLFIKHGPIVQVRERYATKSLPDPDPEIVWDGPLVVLVDRISASASEIFAAALQDYGRALVVGDLRTHGKGTVQTIINLGMDQRFGSLKVTTAGYYRITGQSVQVEGVTADIVVPSRFGAMKLGENYLHNPIKLPPTKRVPFPQINDFGAVIPLLRERSIARRASDSVYESYMRLLGQIEKSMQISELSLNLKDRIKRAQAEKELADLQIKESESQAEKNAKNDPVLVETLAILSDLVSLQSKGMVLLNAESDATDSTHTKFLWSRKWIAVFALILPILLILPVKRKKTQ